MKRMWIGIALLAVMLVSGILVTEFMERTHKPNARNLETAAALVLDGNWEDAEALTAQAQESWQKARHLTASFMDHEPMEEIDGLFAKIAVCAAVQNEQSFSTNCVYLAELMNALGESHSLTFWNLM